MSKGKKISVTIDTNCINAKKNSSYLNKIELANKKGYIKIYKTSVMDTEFIKGEGYLEGLEKSKNYHEDIGPGVWGHSRWGHFTWGSKENGNQLDEIKNILFHRINKLNDKQLRDCLHLRTHFKYKRDYFITSDRSHILNKKESLEKNLKIIVISPKEFCEKILKN